MKNETTQNTTTEPIVIPDECGDTLWDEVLQQEINACESKTVSPKAASLLRDLSADEAFNTDKK